MESPPIGSVRKSSHDRTLGGRLARAPRSCHNIGRLPVHLRFSIPVEAEEEEG
jgi:hypothetical protein